MAVDLCATPWTRIRDIPCGCDAPPLQCEVENFGDLPACPNNFHPSPPAPANTPIVNGDVYVVVNGAGGNPQPFFFWDCNWYPLANPSASDADWFVVGVGGPDYGLGLNTDPAYHEGSIGVNRTTVRGISSLDVTGQVVADGTFTGTPNVPISGFGSRFIWMPEMSAIRAGIVGTTEWDNTNIGEYSAAFNFSNIASGLMSFVANSTNVASARFSTAFGKDNVSSGDHAFTTGQENTAAGFGSFVAGARNTATGTRAIAWGDSSLSSGLRSWAYGESVESKATQSIAWGENIELTAAAEYTYLFGDAIGLPKEVYTQDHSFITHRVRPFLYSPSTAPTDSEIHNNQISFWINEGGNALTFRVKYSTGVLKTGTISLV